jgi:hypothetical protein
LKSTGSAFLQSPFTQLALFSLVAALLPALAAPPVVSNVRTTQRPGPGLVDITYDVADADGDRVAITVSAASR